MRSVAARALFTAVRRELSTGNSGVYRLVVPAPTASLAQDLHEQLLADSVRSFLVTSPYVDISPDRAKAYVRPEGVTSIREGSFVLVLVPGAFSLLQDSVVGSGGTIRAPVFSDQWPWEAEALEGFRFIEDLVPRILESIGVESSEDGPGWLEAIGYLIERLVGDTRQLHASRANVLFDDILNALVPSREWRVEQIENLLWHVGAPALGSAPNADALKRHVEACATTVPRLRMECERPGARQLAIQRVDEVASSLGLVAADLRIHVEALFDALAGGAVSGDGMLGLSAALSKAAGVGQEAWRALTLRTLSALLLDTGSASRVFVDFEAAWASADAPAHITATQRTLVAFSGANAVIDLRIVGAPSAGSISATLGRHQLGAIDSDAGDWTGSLTLNLSDSFAAPEQSQAVSVTYRSREGASQRVKLSLLLQFRTSAPTAVRDASTRAKGDRVSVHELSEAIENAPTIDVSSADRFFVLSAQAGGFGEPRLDSEPVEINPPECGVLELSFADVDVSAGGALLEVPLADKRFLALIRPVVAGRDTATIHDALFEAIISNSKPRVKELLDVFRGVAPAGPHLGSPSRSGRRLLLDLGRHFDGEADYWPLMIQAGDSELSTPTQVKAEGRIRVGLQSPPELGRLRDQAAELSEADRALVARYASARSDTLRLLSRNKGEPGARLASLYSCTPVCPVDPQERAVTESVLTAYLDAYAAICETLRNADRRIGDQFALTHLDSVVVDAATARLLLLGPWHPLSVATRFYLEWLLIDLALDNDTDSGRLARAVRANIPFRWLPGIAGELRPTAFYAAPTDDVAWYAATEADPPKLHAAQAILGGFLGLDAPLVPQSGGAALQLHAEAYLRAHPSKRAIAIQLDGRHSYDDVQTAVSNWLFHNEGEPTKRAAQLPGGVHVRLTGGTRARDVASTWTRPPICLYSEGGTWRGEVDLHLAAGERRLAFESVPPEEAQAGAARGAGAASVLMLPNREVMEAESSVPNARVNEFTSSESARDPLSRALYAAQAAGGAPSRVRTELPMETASGARWIVVPGEHYDPAVFLAWSRNSLHNGLGTTTRVLWDYKIAVDHATASSYYVVSTLPPGLSSLLRGEFLNCDDDVHGALMLLSRVGVSLGNDAYRSAAGARSVIGMVAAIRVWAALWESEHNSCLLLPVDSFTSILGRNGYSSEGEGRYCDLLAIAHAVDEHGVRRLRFSGIESKFRSGGVSPADAKLYAAQARLTAERIERIARRGIVSGAHRLVVARLVEHSLRLGGAQPEAQRQAVSDILSGNYAVDVSPIKALLVSTGRNDSSRGTEELEFDDGEHAWWVRLCPATYPRGGAIPELANVPDPRYLSAQRSSGETDVREAHKSMPPAAESAISGRTEAAPIPESTASAAEEEAHSSLARAIVGFSAFGKPVWYDAAEVGRGTENYNIMITGSSGKGKTQLIKSLLVQLAESGVATTVLDFRNDFAGDKGFLQRAKLSPIWVAHDGLPFNPLIPAPIAHPGTGELHLDIPQHLVGIQAALQRAYGLGDQQAQAVKRAMRDAFVGRGMDPNARLRLGAHASWPDFNDIARSLEAEDARAASRLSPLFDLNVFRHEFRERSFSDLLSGRSVLDLSQVQSEKVRVALAELLIYSAHRHLNAQPHATTLRHLFVFDEAHRLARSPDLEKFCRECRAYGVGVLLASQLLSDLEAGEIARNLATKVFHGNGPDQAAVNGVLRAAGLPPSAADRVAALGLFEAVLVRGSEPASFIRTLGYPQLLLWQHLAGSTPVGSAVAIQEIPEDRIAFVLDQLMALGVIRRGREGEIEVIVSPPSVSLLE